MRVTRGVVLKVVLAGTVVAGLALAAAAQGGEGKGSSAVPQVKNIGDVKESGTYLLHFTAEQWKAATRGAVLVSVRPRAGAWLEFSAVPGEPGAVMAAPMCRSNPLAPMCDYQPQFEVTAGASPAIELGCQCMQGGKVQSEEATRIDPCVLRLQEKGAETAVECVKQRCAGECRLEIFLDPESMTGRLAANCWPPEGAHPSEYLHEPGMKPAPSE
jgi:hypothetical protein